MPEVKSKAPIVLGIGGVLAALAGVYLLFRKKEGVEPPPPPPPGYAQLYGKVTDATTGEPISMAQVTLNGMTTPTTIEGDYLFINLEPGEYVAVFSKDEYETQTEILTLVEGNNEVNVALLPAAFTGFTLALQNVPAQAVLWNANFAENSFYYEPMADSGWLGVDEMWVYPSDPLGCTTLRVWMLDAQNNILLDVRNLGPVNNGLNYIFDAATGMLLEA